MAQIDYIKHLYEKEDKSLREIARICNLNFRTVQKYAKKDNWNEGPKLNRKSNYPILGEYLHIIDKWLEDDTKAPRKQHHTVKKIHSRLQEEHKFKGSYGSVKKYVRKKKKQLRQKMEGFLPLAHPPGHAQIDFGEFEYINGLGEREKAYHLVITFTHSNAGFIQVFKGQNQECLLEGMKRIFNHIGGVPKNIRADNMTTAVIKVLKEGKRELSEGFLRFKLHYRFEAEFCNPASGHEKGNVENKVGYSRRNFFVPVPVIEDFEVFNKELFNRCEEDMKRPHYIKEKTIADLWNEEKNHLLHLPEHDYDAFRYEALRINNYGFIDIDTNKYGVSPELCGKTAHAKIYFNRIDIYHDHFLMASYDRSYNKNEEVVDWRQYIKLLCKKPGAFEHTRFFNQIPKLWREHIKNLSYAERKSALMLLLEIVNEDAIDLGNDAIEFAKLHGRNDTDSIRQFYYSLTHDENNPLPINLSSDTPVIGYNPSLTPYDVLTSKEVI